MYRRVYQATHPDMMAGASNDALRERYLVTRLLEADTISPGDACFDASPFSNLPWVPLNVLLEELEKGPAEQGG